MDDIVGIRPPFRPAPHSVAASAPSGCLTYQPNGEETTAHYV